MNGRDFLATAGRLAGGSEEPDWRSAASRAYYACFHVARDLLSALRFVAPRADRAHDYLYFRLNNCGHGGVQRTARRLHDLRSLRNRADYDLRQPFVAIVAAGAVATAASILQTLDGLTPAELTQITDAMKVYEQQIGDVTWRP
jgi:uncharacterized protein (UPF0332 family)